MKDDKRTNAGRSGAGDPFADLVRTIEGVPPQRAGGSYGGFEPVEVPQSSWEQFSYVPAPGGPSAARIEPVGGLAAPRARPRRTAAEADAEIEEALRGLSQPARPRVNAPAETQSFAPARLDDPMPPAHQTMTEDDFDELIASELAAMRPVGATPLYDEDDEDEGYVDDFDDRSRGRPVHHGARRRSMPLYAGIAFLALVAGGGAYTFLTDGAGTGGGDQLLLKADAEPYKIAPADPGGRSIPNQNKAVYDRVAAGGTTLAPTQQSLVTAVEEPVELPADEDGPSFDLPGVSYGDEIPSDTVAQVASAAPDDSQTLQPRRVRTLTVRPDGTLVVEEAPAAEPPAALIATAATALASEPSPMAAPEAAPPVDDDVSQMITASTMPGGTSAAAGIPVAAPPPPPAAALPQVRATGEGFFVQIASQPSEAAARESLDNMARRFAQVIGSRSMGIQAAEVEGRGTFYRVRVATETRNEANSVCESLKSAGGSCFVTR